MRVDELKNKILQLAIQGKLVPQDENDIPASVLLEEIKKEKEKLIREKKIKKEKPLPEITEEEKPFELPKGWEWVRLGEIGYTNIGLTYSPKDVSSNGTPVLRSTNIQNGKIDLNDLVYVKGNIPENKMCKRGDILICARNGSKRLVGKCAIINEEEMSFGAFMAIYRSKYNKYINLVLNSELFRNQLGDSNTVTINQITQEMLKKTICPLPSVAEQLRIVQKVDELFEIIDELAENKEVMIKNISDTRNKVLQLAIQGKLVEQNPEDTPASVLLEEIRKEKELLIKEKKIKKEKPLPEITEEEKPFELPKDWEWVRVQDVLNVRRGASPRPISKFLTEDEGVNWIKIGDTNSNSKYIDSTKEKITVEGAKKSVYLEKGALILSNSMSFGKPYILNINGCIHDGWLSLTTYRDLINKEFLRYVFLGSKNFFEKEAVGSGVRNLNIERVSKMPMALPSVAEQLRIVQKVDEIMAYLDELEKTII